MTYKGKEVQPHRVKMKRQSHIQEIKDVSNVVCDSMQLIDSSQVAETPSFALPVNRSTKSDLLVREKSNGSLPKLNYKLSFENRPVDKVVVLIDMPTHTGHASLALVKT